MDFSVITQLISSIGFPIVMCIILIWYIKDTSDKSLEERKNYYAELQGVKDAINNNSVVMQKLLSRFDEEE